MKDDLGAVDAGDHVAGRHSCWGKKFDAGNTAIKKVFQHSGNFKSSKSGTEAEMRAETERELMVG
jgi:hypothetical protein